MKPSTDLRRPQKSKYGSVYISVYGSVYGSVCHHETEAPGSAGHELELEFCQPHMEGLQVGSGSDTDPYIWSVYGSVYMEGLYGPFMFLPCFFKL